MSVTSASPQLAITPVSYGKEARDALHEAIAAAKSGDPLAPVTVVVPSRVAGVELRRHFASQSHGIAAVEFTTLRRLADRLAMRSMLAQSRRPVNDTIVGAVVRAALADSDGMFAVVAHHPSTQAEFVRIYRELRTLDEASLDRLTTTTRRAREVVAVCRRVAAVLSERHYDERDALDAAAALVASGEAAASQLEQVGSLVVFLPKQLSSKEAKLLLALADADEVRIIVGVTGNRQADAGVRELVRQLDGDENALTPEATGVKPATLDEVLDVSDQDEEVRHVVRRVLADIDEGVPATQIAVFAPSQGTYSRILADHLDAAGVAWHGISPQALGESITGRVAGGLLGLVGGELARQDVFNLLSVGVLRREPPRQATGDDVTHNRVPVARWERLTRAAGVAGGDDWSERLKRYADKLRGDAGEGSAESHDDIDDADWVAKRKKNDAAECCEIVKFMKDLKERLADATTLSGWADICDWFHGLLFRYLGVRFSGASGQGDADMTPANWPRGEQEAARRIHAFVDELKGLDDIEPDATVTTLAAVLSTRLRQSIRLQPGGSAGVNVAPIEDSEFFMARRAYVLGLAEGLYPKRVPPDTLIGEEERAALDGELERVGEQVTSQHHSLLGVLAATRSTGGRVVGLVPRGSMRRTSENVESRWLAEVSPSAEHTSVASFFSGVRGAPFPVTPWERDAADILRLGWKRWASTVDAPASSPVKAARAAAAARRSGAFTRFDGNLEGVLLERDQLGGGDDNRQIGPTTLEAWATCPRSYLFKYLLGVAPVEEPDELLTLSAPDYGHIVHKTLEDFARHLGDERRLPGPDKPYRTDDPDKLVELAETHFARVEAEGRAGYELPWQVSRAQIISDLRAFCEVDEQRAEREQPRGVLIDAEARFGSSGHWDESDEPAAEPISYELGDGGAVLFRGSIDRVERLADGSLLVIDYKTGKPDPYKRIISDSAGDFTLSGTKLQLPIYALAAEALYGANLRASDNGSTSAAPTSGMYWFVTSRKGSWSDVTIAFDDEARDRFAQVVDAIAKGINQGVFVGKPEAGSDRRGGHTPCEFCDPDGLRTAQLRRDFVRKAQSAALAILASRERQAAVDAATDRTADEQWSPTGLGLLLSLDLKLKALYDD